MQLQIIGLVAVGMLIIVLTAVAGEAMLKLNLLAPMLFENIERSTPFLLGLGGMFLIAALASSLVSKRKLLFMLSVIALGLSAAVIGMPSAIGLPMYEAEDDPKRLPVVNMEIDPSTWVVGITVGDESVAYRADDIKHRLVVNDVLDGQRIVTAFCNSCNSALAYRSRINNTDTLFDIIGTFKIDVVLKDQLTGSWWDAGTGKLLAGNAQNATLEQIPATMAQWEQWLKIAPNTEVANFR